MGRPNGEPFTPTQLRILQVLADGLPHRKEELHACLPDELGPLSNIKKHLAGIRQAIRPSGHDIVCVYFHRRTHYQRVRLLAAAAARYRTPLGEKAPE